MELNVTHMLEAIDDSPPLVGSIAQYGPNAAEMTWGNSKAFGREHPLLKTDEERDAARAHFRGYGAWDEAEIAAWSDEELQGITCQEVAHQISEMEMFDTEEEYREASERGTVSGRLYKGDDGQWYCYFGI
jgi:hypothetical protein